MPVPFRVKAVFDYRSDEPDDLNFSVGQIITVTEEDDADWYTGEYESPNGKTEGLFPRNFVERYEPAIPSRPVRNTQKPTQYVVPPMASAQPDSTPTSPPQATSATRTEPPVDMGKAESTQDSVPKPTTEVRPSETKAPATKQPPPVAEKPASNSFKDRIAAFNKATAAPITPFKPSGNSSGTGFVKKPFVAPPPSRNSYVPPPAHAAPPTKVYRREEDPEMVRQEEEGTADAPRNEPVEAEDQPKPTSLKDRIALLQQQQLEQAQRAAEKKKTKKPAPLQRADSADNDLETIETTEAPLTRQDTGDTAGKKSLNSEHGAAYHVEESVGTPEEEVVHPTVVPPPARELVSDTNDADDSGAGDTEDAQETFTEEERRIAKSIKSPPLTTAEFSRPGRKETIEETAGEEGGDEQEAEEEEDDEDPEIRRRRELRERMAKMSGGMGMMGMFGPPGGASAASKKSRAPKAEKPSSESQHEEETTRAPPVPVMALPGMSSRSQKQEPEEIEEEEMASPTPVEPIYKTTAPDEDYISHQPTRASTDRSGPTSPYDRAAPPPPPREIRAPPVPPSAQVVFQSSQSPPGRSNLPPPPPPPTRDETMDHADFPRTSMSERFSTDNKPLRQPSIRKEPSALPPGAPPPPPARTMTSESIGSTQSTQEKRVSRPPPPPPAATPASPQTRAPPPPPPGQAPGRSMTGGSRGITGPDDGIDEESEEGEVTEYDGDYDTDIASSAKHKDALKSHNRDSSIEDEEALTDEAHKLPSSPPTRAVPPLPPTSPPRAVPPLPPSASAPKSRMSSEVPRAAPPPIPSAAMMAEDKSEDYDPYRYTAPQQGIPSPPPQPKSPPLPFAPGEGEDQDLYGAPVHAPPPMPPSSQQVPSLPVERMGPLPPPPSERAVPPPPPQSHAPMMAGGLGPVPASVPPPKQSTDVSRSQTVSRRSAEHSRPSADFGFMASDLELSEATLWWTQDNTPPPSIASRTDVLFEVESNAATKRGGKTTINRDIYVLYMDYSQTTINVSFDPNDPTSASLSQSHQRPPPPPRQDQLESVSRSFGSKVATAGSQAAGTTVADGSAQGFIWTLLQPLRGTALMPIGNRSFGAPVYSNLANASTQQFDEIRPGDIVTFRNAKFSGHKGGLHQKYTMEAGQPGRDHAAVVIDWDGTKKKIRAWEQGRDDKRGSKGRVKEESFRIGDLKSGEVRVWRIMGRSWVGWDQS